MASTGTALASGREGVARFGSGNQSFGGQRHLTHSLLKEIRGANNWREELQDGLRGFVQRYLTENLNNIDVELKRTTGPGVTNADLARDVLIPLLVIQNGLMLSRSQYKTLFGFRTLLTDTIHPSETPQAAPVFVLTYKDFEQSLAQPGNIHTIVGGNASTTYEVSMRLTSKTTGLSIGDISIFMTNNPHDIATTLAEKFTQMETTWNLTMAMDHARYCAAQPGLAETLIINRHLTELNEYGQLHSVLQLESLLAASVNRNQYNLARVVAAGIKAIGRRPDECLVVVPQIILKSMVDVRDLYAAELSGDLTPRVMVYSTNHPEGLNGRLAITSTNTEVEYDALYPRSVDATLSKRKPHEGFSGLAVGGEAVPIIPLDDTPLSASSNFSIQSALARPATKRLFFTVGVPPNCYSRFAVAGFFAGNMSIRPGDLVMRTPSISYISSWERGQKMEEIRLTSVHRVANTAAAFDTVSAVARFRRLDRAAVGAYTEANSVAILRESTFGDKLALPASRLEGSTRFMIATLAAAADQACNDQVLADVVGGPGGLILVPRTILGNTSPLNDLRADIVNVISGMVTHAPIPESLSPLLDLMKHAFADTGRAAIADVLRFREAGRAAVARLATAGQPTAAQIRASRVPNEYMDRVLSRAGGHLPMSDFGAQLAFLYTLDRAEEIRQEIIAAAAAGGGNAAPDMPMWLEEDSAPALAKLKGILLNGYAAVRALIDKLYQSREFSYVLAATEPLVDQPAWLINNSDMLRKFFYGVIAPAFTASLTFDAAPTGMRTNIANGVFMPRYDNNGVFVSSSTQRQVRANTINLADCPAAVSAGMVSVFGPLFKARMAVGHSVLGAGTYEMVLWVAHLTTAFNMNMVTRHADVSYPSTLSYVGVRTARFTGYDVAVMPKNSANLIFGNMYSAWPVSSATSSVFSQVVESAIYPKELESTGAVLRNVFCNKISGYNADIRPGTSSQPIIFLDCPSSFSLETKTTAGNVLDIIPLAGRYDGDDAYASGAIDPMTGYNTICPSLNPISSDSVEVIRNWIENNDPPQDHSYVTFIQALDVGDFRAALPGELRNLVNRTRAAVIEDIVSGNIPGSAFTDILPVAFCDSFGIGGGSDVTSKRAKESDGPDAMLTPVVMGEGMVASYMTGEDTAYVAKFGRLTGLEADLHTYPNQY